MDFNAALDNALGDNGMWTRVRCFDVGGSGIKTGLLEVSLLQDVLTAESAADAALWLPWMEDPRCLGKAPSTLSCSSWLREMLPTLRKEVASENVLFGVSTSGDVDVVTGELRNDYWSGGGMENDGMQQNGRRNVAACLGIPAERMHVLHDGAAHLLGAVANSYKPMPNTASFALGTGVGFGVSDGAGLLVDPMGHPNSHSLGGVPLYGSDFDGILLQRWYGIAAWPPRKGGKRSHKQQEVPAQVRAVLEQEFAGSEMPFSTPWTSLWLGRRGLEVAEAVHGVTDRGERSTTQQEEAHDRALKEYAQQWLHFLQTRFLPEHGNHIERIVFSGKIVERNWPLLAAVIAPDGKLNKSNNTSGPCLQVERAADNAALLGAAKYALGGGSRSNIWPQ